MVPPVCELCPSCSPVSAGRLTNAFVPPPTAQRWRTLGARSFSEAYGRLKSAYYRKWGAAIARANAGLRRARLEYVGGRGNRVREYAADDGLGVAAPGALGELVADVGGGFGGGFGDAAA